ncbi:hypothetical protein GCM10027440_37420 [Nocardiopsis coralliicola]
MAPGDPLGRGRRAASAGRLSADHAGGPGPAGRAAGAPSGPGGADGAGPRSRPEPDTPDPHRSAGPEGASGPAEHADAPGRGSCGGESGAARGSSDKTAASGAASPHDTGTDVADEDAEERRDADFYLDLAERLREAHRRAEALPEGVRIPVIRRLLAVTESVKRDAARGSERLDRMLEEISAQVDDDSTR